MYENDEDSLPIGYAHPWYPTTYNQFKCTCGGTITYNDKDKPKYEYHSDYCDLIKQGVIKKD